MSVLQWTEENSLPDREGKKKKKKKQTKKKRDNFTLDDCSLSERQTSFQTLKQEKQGEKLPGCHLLSKDLS